MNCSLQTTPQGCFFSSRCSLQGIQTLFTLTAGLRTSRVLGFGVWFQIDGVFHPADDWFSTGDASLAQTLDATDQHLVEFSEQGYTACIREFNL